MANRVLVAWALLSIAGCSSPHSGTRVDPTLQPLGASIPSAEPSTDAREFMINYLHDRVYSDAVPTIELRNFRGCFADAIFSLMTREQQVRLEQIVASHEKYKDSTIIGLTNYFEEAVDSSEVRSGAASGCPGYASRIAAMP